MKKEFKLEVVNGRMYKLSWKNGGVMPAELSGLYTSDKVALDAAQAYLNKRDKVNAENYSRKK